MRVQSLVQEPFEKVMPEIFNHRLVRLDTATPSTEAGTGLIELPGQGLNLRWQTRRSAPTPYENALADAIELAYLAGAAAIAGTAALVLASVLAITRWIAPARPHTGD